jgi:hypothetical protein
LGHWLAAAAVFACFTSTKVHILTQKALQPVTLGHWLAAAAVFVSMVNIGGGFVMTNRMLGILVQKYLPLLVQKYQYW